jgi:DNA invertase Pin-like site-specific DNA recombinase
MKRPKRAGLYARVSTEDQKSLPQQIRALKQYAAERGWTVTHEVEEIASGAKTRPKRDELMEAARRREIDCVIVSRLDRWGRSLGDLVTTLDEFSELGVAFVSLTEALDLTTSTGRAMAGMIAVFAEFERELIRERVRAGIAEAKRKGTRFGRPRTGDKHAEEVRQLFRKTKSQRATAAALGLRRTTVRRLLSERT